MILEVRKNGALKDDKKVFELDEDEKLAGYEFYHNNQVLFAVGFKIVRMKAPVGGKNIEEVLTNRSYQIVNSLIQKKKDMGPEEFHQEIID